MTLTAVSFITAREEVFSLTLNNIGIVQCGNDSNIYFLYLPQNICIAQIAMPPDKQYMNDMKVLDYITKALETRWGICKKGK